ncbi:hypothetical protein Dda_1235 [Drechslerella dactyloides]|uniref:Uncharacterized protein n=1 Tax=Drechslerella dactyloides TaxID=74499 RepID=A0AAD6J7J1_DREDA|nr:hypothetical protein Dda_1235 [Drechslerella dactyloides]
MSATIDNNLLDLQRQPTSADKTPLDVAPSRSLLHYERVDKKCLSLQILPYTRPYVIPVSKIHTSDGLVQILSTLPEIRATVQSPDSVQQKFDSGAWRLLDEAGLLIRIHDWEDLITPGAQIIIDTNGVATRAAEKYASEQVQDAPSEPKFKANDISSSKWSTGNWKPASQPDNQDEDKPLTLTPTPAIPDDSLPETPSQGDPEWMSWGGPAATESSSVGWDAGGHVAPADDAWGDQDNRSSSTHSFRRGGQRSNSKWHSAQANSNHWDKSRFPAKVHLTFYATFQLPRRYPPTPSGPYSRFSIEVDTCIWQVATKVFGRPPFDTMKPPANVNLSELEYVWLELRFVSDHGRPSLESGRRRRIKGKITLAELGLTVDGGDEGMGRYYFMIDDSFVQPPTSNQT